MGALLKKDFRSVFFVISLILVGLAVALLVIYDLEGWDLATALLLLASSFLSALSFFLSIHKIRKSELQNKP